MAMIAEGTPEEISKLLSADIAIHRQNMHKALDIALEFLQLLQDSNDDEQKGTYMPPLYAVVSDRIGRKLTKEEEVEIFRTLMDELVAAGGMSRCHSWELAHTIEHLMQGKTH